MTTTPQPKQPERSLLVIFHCGVFFLLYAVFMTSIGRKDVEEMAAQMPPDYIRNVLILMTGCFVGYLGLWNMRKWGVITIALGGIALIAYAGSVGVWSPPLFFPVLAALTTFPMWPVMK